MLWRRWTDCASPLWPHRHGLEAQFQFTPVFSDGRSGDAVTVELYLLAEANGVPVAENLELTTYKKCGGDCPVFRRRPRGGSAHVSYPQQARPRGADHAGGRQQQICLHPYENKTGKDSFTYVAVDAAGNSSDPATINKKKKKIIVGVFTR